MRSNLKFLFQQFLTKHKSVLELFCKARPVILTQRSFARTKIELCQVTFICIFFIRKNYAVRNNLEVTISGTV